MRITNGMMVSGLMTNLQNNMERLNEYNRQLSTGKKFDVPSDDPTGAIRSMGLNTTLSNQEQYIKNVDEGITWLGVTEEALSQVTDVVQRTRELAVYGASGSLSDTDRQAIADEVKELRENITELANTKYGGRFVFSGNKTLQAPYPTSDSEYKGDSGKIKREISMGTEVTINMDGSYFEGLLAEMGELADNLTTGDTEAISNTDIGELDQEIDTLLRLRSETGAKQKRFEMTKKRLDSDKIKFTKLLSQNEDVDIAETIMNLQMSENVYRAALSSGGRIIQPSLVDFVK